MILFLAATLLGAPPFDHQHTQWGEVLAQHVSDGSVAYGVLAKAPSALNVYLQRLQSVSPKTLRGFGRNQTKAFWINAFNAATVKLIVDKRPKNSVFEIGKPFTEEKFNIAGQSLTLNDIEHNILRKKFPDARLHAALVCGAVSCPILQSEPYVASKLERQLDRASRRWVRDKTRNRFDAGKHVYRVSKIFRDDWFQSDFNRDFGAGVSGDPKTAGVRGFLKKYGSVGFSEDVRIEYLEYDWALNGTW